MIQTSPPHVHNKNHNQFCGCNPSNHTQYSARFREYSARRDIVRSIQHLRQIVRVFIKHYGYTHFLNFQWANIILICCFFLARFARSILKQWAIMSGVTIHAPIALEISLLQPYNISATLMCPYLLSLFESCPMHTENCFGR